MHYAFPVMDEESCFLLKRGQLEKVSKNLVCVVLATGTANWFLSDTLKMHPKPDLHYIWNKVGTLCSRGEQMLTLPGNQRAS
jgi:hypothetical protein